MILYTRLSFQHFKSSNRFKQPLVKAYTSYQETIDENNRDIETLIRVFRSGTKINNLLQKKNL